MGNTVLIEMDGPRTEIEDLLRYLEGDSGLGCRVLPVNDGEPVGLGGELLQLFELAFYV